VSLELIIHEIARHDIDERTFDLDDNTPDVGDRFLAELNHVFDRLLRFPKQGPPFPTANHPTLRRIVLATLPLSVFYQPTRSAIEIFRVLHHAQDIPELLDKIDH
jgi:plasmid stabilization system protein ParE